VVFSHVSRGHRGLAGFNSRRHEGHVAPALAYGLEDQVQRHLDDARASYAVLDEACPGGTLSGTKRARAANSRDRAEPLAREPTRSSLHIGTEARIQTYVIVRRVKAWVIKNVEELHIVAQ
jgi:hypothetical protein